MAFRNIDSKIVQSNTSLPANFPRKCRPLKAVEACLFILYYGFLALGYNLGAQMKRSKPERELTDEEKNVVISVRHCARELDDILQGARRKAQSNVRVFAETGISVLFRAVDCYADMYEKLGLKSREALERLFSKLSECEDVQDTQDAIDETEGNWRNFLRNIDKEFKQEDSVCSSENHSEDPKCDYIYLPSIQLIDCQTNKEFSLLDLLRTSTCLVIVCQPAYWPDTGVRWRHSETEKVKCDLSQFNVNYAIITWGPAEEVRSWSKLIARATKWPVLWDKQGDFCKQMGFNKGLENIWACEGLGFLGCQRSKHNRTVNPPPVDINWLIWNQIGGEVVLAQPVAWNCSVVNPDKMNQQQSSLKRKSDSSDDEPGKSAQKDLENEALKDKEAMKTGKTKVCVLHRSKHLADFMPSGSIYQAALTCYARAHGTTEAAVMDKIRRDRRLSTAPESARLQYEPTTGLYYDPETSLYYDSARGYFYDASHQMYYYWSQTENRYMEANTIIRAELAAAQAAQAASASAAVARAAEERERARQAAMRVAAQLAEIRARKDDYAAYAYATCVLPHQEASNPDCHTDDVIRTAYQNTTAAANHIESSLKAWNSGYANTTKPLVPYGDEPVGGDSTPPPPGL